MKARYFKVLLPSRLPVGAATTKTFTSREEAEAYLKEENHGLGGEILEVNKTLLPLGTGLVGIAGFARSRIGR